MNNRLITLLPSLTTPLSNLVMGCLFEQSSFALLFWFWTKQYLVLFLTMFWDRYIKKLVELFIFQVPYTLLCCVYHSLSFAILHILSVSLGYVSCSFFLSTLCVLCLRCDPVGKVSFLSLLMSQKSWLWFCISLIQLPCPTLWNRVLPYAI